MWGEADCAWSHAQHSHFANWITWGRDEFFPSQTIAFLFFHKLQTCIRVFPKFSNANCWKTKPNWLPMLSQLSHNHTPIGVQQSFPKVHWTRACHKVSGPLTQMGQTREKSSPLDCSATWVWITPRTARYIKLRTFGGTHSVPKTDHTCIGTRDETIGNAAAAILVWSPLLTEQVPWLIKDPHPTIKSMNIIQRNPNNQIYIILNKETERIQIQLTPLDNINSHTYFPSLLETLSKLLKAQVHQGAKEFWSLGARYRCTLEWCEAQK